jgi:hypothetical protein
VRINPLLVLLSILVAASIGSWIGGLFGGFVAALLAIPAAGALQVVVAELWRSTAPPQAGPSEQEPPPPPAAPVQPDGRRSWGRRLRLRQLRGPAASSTSRTEPGH